MLPFLLGHTLKFLQTIGHCICQLFTCEPIFEALSINQILNICNAKYLILFKVFLIWTHCKVEILQMVPTHVYIKICIGSPTVSVASRAKIYKVFRHIFSLIPNFNNLTERQLKMSKSFIRPRNGSQALFLFCAVSFP